MSLERPRSVLIFRIGSIGDTVVALPCFHAIARAYPRHRKVLLTNAVASARASSVESVLEGSGLIDATVYFPVGSGQLVHSVCATSAIAPTAPEALVYLAPRPEACPYTETCLVRGRRHPQDHRRASDPSTATADRFDHGRARIRSRASGTGMRPAITVDLSAPNWDLRLSSAEHAVAETPVRGGGMATFCSLCRRGQDSEKDWGAERWAALITLLERRASALTLVLRRAPDERPLIERLAKLWSGPT